MVAAILFVLTALGSPVQARTIDFSGRRWSVKSSGSLVALGPGPNRWSSDNVWVDPQGRLHLRIAKWGDQWYCAEVFIDDIAPEGGYRFTIEGRPDQLDPNIVLGLFLYEADDREADIEFSRWGGDTPGTNAQFVVQGEAAHRFSLNLRQPHSIYSMLWKDGSVKFEGGDVGWTSPASAIRAPRLHINLWLYRGQAPSDGREAEVIVSRVDGPLGR